MTRMHNMIAATVFCLLAVLSGAGLLAATESQYDEEITTMPPPAPDPAGEITPTPRPRPVIPVVPPVVVPPVVVPPVAPPVVVPPEKDITIPAAPQVITPTIPTAQPSPVEEPAIPAVPQVITPTIPTAQPSPVEEPAIPVAPPEGAPAIPVAPPVVPPVAPPEGAPVIPVATPGPVITPKPEPAPGPEPNKPVSPVDFLVKPTSLDPGKEPEPKGTPKERPEAPKPKPTPPQTAQAKPKRGEQLRIPPDAAKRGDLSFLEGCWRGTRPEYHTKRTITERFCFGKNGSGKRTIEDPGNMGRCIGATRGSFDAQGKLVVTSEEGRCTRGGTWGAAHMICQGEGSSTPCFWRFPSAGGGTQSYRIPLVRE